MPNGKRNCFADTNLLVYAIDPAAAEKRRRVTDLLRLVIRNHTLVLSPQSLNECHRVVAHRRSLMPRDEARQFVSAWRSFCTAPYNFDVTAQAWHIQDRYGFSWWDCTLLSSALLAGCDVFLSEDMQHEQKVAGLTVLSPFNLDLRRDF
jgi:predicted nucleic acid-binding protein